MGFLISRLYFLLSDGRDCQMGLLIFRFDLPTLGKRVKGEGVEQRWSAAINVLSGAK